MRNVLFLSCQGKVDILGNTSLLWMTITLIFNLHALKALLFFLFCFLFLKSFIQQRFWTFIQFQIAWFPGQVWWWSIGILTVYTCHSTLQEVGPALHSGELRTVEGKSQEVPGLEKETVENDQGLKEALELIKLTKISQQDRCCSLQEFENLRRCYHWSLIGGVEWTKARNARCSALHDLIVLTKTHPESNRTFECPIRRLSGWKFGYNCLSLISNSRHM